MEKNKVISLNHSHFFLPTTQFRQLAILLAVHHEPNLSQHRIAAQCHMSSAMAHQYIRTLHKKELILVQARNKRDRAYRLTDSGRQWLFSLLMRCSAEIVQLYAQAKVELIEKFSKLFGNQPGSRIVLFGGSETASLVIQALHQVPAVTIAGIVDNDPSKWSTCLEGIPIQSPDNLEGLDPTAIVIASFAKHKEIHDSIRHLENKGITICTLASI